jgi:hypothetical protein
MTTILAALDNSLAAAPVLANAVALGRMLDAEVRAVHVVTDGARTARGAAEAAGVTLETSPGPVVERLAAEAEAPDVRALVLGARGTPAGRRPVGTTALTLATSVSKPLLVVPPDARPVRGLGRVLVPVEGRLSPLLTPREIVELAQGAELEVVVLHVHDEETLPAFTDQPQHEQPAWAREFLRRYCPWGISDLRLEVRVGRVEDLVVAVAEQTDVDVVALGWAQQLAEGRAPVVRAALARAHVPVLLVPVRAAPEVA